MKKKKKDSARCSCGHTRRQHWLAGGTVKDEKLLTRANTGSVAWLAYYRGERDTPPHWPPYYRTSCIVPACACEKFRAAR